MGNLETVYKLLALRCDPNPPLVGLGVTPLLSAVALSRGNPKGLETVRALLTLGAFLGMGQNSARNWTAEFRPWLHLPRGHFGYPFLTHSQIMGAAGEGMGRGGSPNMPLLSPY